MLAIMLAVASFVLIESLGVPLPGETVVVAALLVSFDGQFSPWAVTAAAIVGAIVGDSLGYLLGRRWGVHLLEIAARRMPNRFGPQRLRAAITTMNRYGLIAVASGRFVAILRILVGPLAGTLGMRYRRFLVGNVIGAVLWAVSLTAVVTLAGRAAFTLIRQFSWVALALLAVVLIVGSVMLVYRARRRTSAFAAVEDGLCFSDVFQKDGSLSPLAETWGREDGADAQLKDAAATVLRPVWAVLRRTPFASTMLAVVLAVGIIGGALWHPIRLDDWYGNVAYGLPAFEAGRWWTVVTGSLFFEAPVHYVIGLLGLWSVLAWGEWRLGSGRTVLLFAAGQLFTLLASALFLWLLSGIGWEWADRVSDRLDVGPSGGLFAVGAAVLLTLRSPWRLRLQFALIAYVTVMLVYVGTIADVEHFFAVVGTIAVTPLLGWARRGRGRPSLREWRILAFTSLIVLAVVQVLAALIPTDDPLGTTQASGAALLDTAIDIAIILLIANGVRRGHRLAWIIGVAAGLFNVAEFVVLTLAWAFSSSISPSTLVALTNSALWIGVLVLLVLGRGAYRVPLRRSHRRLRGFTDTNRTHALRILEEQGGGTLSWMTTWSENSYFATSTGTSFLAYQRFSGAAIGLGDPIGPVEERCTALREFVEDCERVGIVPCLFAASDETVALAPPGWRSFEVAQDTIVDLPTLELTGKRWQDVRTAINRAEREAVEFRMTRLADEPWEILSQVRAISETWVGDRALPEMRFTLGGVEEALDPRVRTALAVDATGTVHGATSWLPVLGEDGTVRGWTLDLMRRRETGFKSVMEFLIARSCLRFQEEGAAFASLSGAPLASVQGARAEGVQRLLGSVSRTLEPLYGFQSLHNFKTKFHPRYERMSLLYRDESDLPRIGLALTRAFLPQQSLLELARSTRLSPTAVDVPVPVA